MAKIPGLLQNKKGYWFVRWVDLETGARREKTLGRDKAEAERRYEEWRRELRSLFILRNQSKQRSPQGR